MSFDYLLHLQPGQPRRLYRLQRRNARPISDFPDTPDGRANCRTWLQDHADAAVLLYSPQFIAQQVTLGEPALSGRDRSTWLRHRVSQHFGETAWSGWQRPTKAHDRRELTLFGLLPDSSWRDLADLPNLAATTPILAGLTTSPNELPNAHISHPLLHSPDGRRFARHRQQHRRAQAALLGAAALAAIFALWRASTVQFAIDTPPPPPSLAEAPPNLPGKLTPEEALALASHYGPWLNQAKASPAPAWRHIAQALEHCPQIDLQELEWQQETDGEVARLQARIVEAPETRPCFDNFASSLGQAPYTARFEPQPFAGTQGALPASKTSAPPSVFKAILEKRKPS